MQANHIDSGFLYLCFVCFPALSGNEGFILNGDYVVSMFKKEIKVGNAVIEYSGSDSYIERINSTYRIDQEIILQVKNAFFYFKKANVTDTTVLFFIWGGDGESSRGLQFILCFSVIFFSQVLSVGNLYNPDVRYTFNIPIEDKPQQFYWNIYGPWQPCSKVCQGM